MDALLLRLLMESDGKRSKMIRFVGGVDTCAKWIVFRGHVDDTKDNNRLEAVGQSHLHRCESSASEEGLWTLAESTLMGKGSGGMS